jgi:hypothetical protein
MRLPRREANLPPTGSARSTALLYTRLASPPGQLTTWREIPKRSKCGPRRAVLSGYGHYEHRRGNCELTFGQGFVVMPALRLLTILAKTATKSSPIART